MAKPIFCLLTVIAVSILIAPAATAQQLNRSIKGTVRDSNGAVVVGAAVVVSRGGQERSTTTDSEGNYSTPDLSPGKYAVTVTAQNFQTRSREVDLTNGETLADFSLAAGGIAAEVTISAATRYERSAEDLPLSVTVIPRREILNSPGQTVDDELRYVAGVNLQRDNADVIFPVIPSIAVRGLGVGDTATRSLVLLDGLPINGGYWGAVFWHRAPEYTIERLEVVRGSSSSLFGSFAMGGAVNIVTHTPEKRELNGELQYGENQRFRSSLQYGDVVANDRIAFSINTNYYTTNGFYRVLENDRRPVDEREHAISKNFQGRSSFKFSESARGFIRAGYYDQDRIGDHQLASTNVSLSDVAGGVDFDLKDRGVISTRLFYSAENVLIDNVRVVNDTTTFVSNSHDNEADIFGFSTQWSKAFNRTVSHLSVGVDFRRVDGTNDQDVFNAPNTLSAEILGGGTQTATGVFCGRRLSGHYPRGANGQALYL